MECVNCTFIYILKRYNYVSIIKLRHRIPFVLLLRTDNHTRDSPFSISLFLAHKTHLRHLNLCINRHRRDCAVRRCWPGSCQWVCSWCMQRCHGAHSQMSQILQFSQIGQLQIQWVHHSPSVDRQDRDSWPAQHHKDVVGEDQVVDDRKEEECQQPEHGKDCKGPDPGQHFLLIFLKGQRIDD